MENVKYEEYTIQLNKEDMIFLYTDGITEANNNYEKFYGEDNLRNILNKNKDSNLENISDIVQDDIKHVIGDVSQYDDETLLILKYE